MAASEIKAKFGPVLTLDISPQGLASSSTNVGVQSAFVDNTGSRYRRIFVYAKITVGVPSGVNKSIRFHLLKADTHASPYRTDGAAATNTGITLVNAPCVASILVPVTTANTAYYLDFIIENPGPNWAIAVVHDTGNALNATPVNHFIRYIGENPEAQ